jgi:hypothetical protein
MGTSHGSVLIECPGCNRERFVSARTARRGAGRCRWCLAGDGHIERPDDDDRRWWLERFDDAELCEMATLVVCRPGSLRRIRAERERLLGRVVVDGLRSAKVLGDPGRDVPN